MKTVATTGNSLTQEASDLNSQLVDGPKLLEILFPPDCRPTLRWLRDQQKARRIPFVKIGRLVFFSPANVRTALEKKQK
jgi:uncharacterized protein YbaR (Trm112 family)